MNGKEFRRWRREKEISQTTVGTYCNVDKSTICRWEKGLIKVHEDVYDKIMQFVANNN